MTTQSQSGMERMTTIVRGCDGCTLCCKVFSIAELLKPGNQWCPHCIKGKGCGIYERRPTDCATFACGYLVMPHLGPEWKPAISHLIISSEYSVKRMNIHVDQGRPDAWRKEPYYSAIKRWSVDSLPRGEMVIVMLGRRCIVPLADRDVDLGVVGPDKLILIGERLTAKGRVYEPFVAEAASAVGQKIAAAGGGEVTMSMADVSGLERGRTVV